MIELLEDGVNLNDTKKADDQDDLQADLREKLLKMKQLFAKYVPKVKAALDTGRYSVRRYSTLQRHTSALQAQQPVVATENSITMFTDLI